MTYILRIIPDVEDDLASSYAWYKRKSIYLAEAFLNDFFRGLRRSSTTLKYTLNASVKSDAIC